ncbi:creatininase family protein [Pseudonocardia zijingensis]|uniref:creatininase family protein n=1 Tax=Pseudonocardia zijingensis TaxID=153376 RepID=UPI0031D488DE
MDLLPVDTTSDARDRAGAVALLPIGSFEQHGPHLPLTTDTLVAATIAVELASVYPVFRLPPLTISCSHEHAAWPGTVSISATTLVAIVRDVSASVQRSGASGLVLVNGHGGNYVLGNVVQEASLDPFPTALFPTEMDWEDARADAGLTTTGLVDMHAGELETSILLHVLPDLVKPGYEQADHRADDRRHLLARGMQAYAESGVVGLPSQASAEKGRAVLESLVRSFAAHL